MVNTIIILFIVLTLCLFYIQMTLSESKNKFWGLIMPGFLFLGSVSTFWASQDAKNFIILNTFSLLFLLIYIKYQKIMKNISSSKKIILKFDFLLIFITFVILVLSFSYKNLLPLAEFIINTLLLSFIITSIFIVIDNKIKK